MKNIPPVFYGNDHPVERLSWGMIQEFVTKLNAHTGKTFRVPTEAEWEYAAVGGRESKGYFYCGSDLLDEVAWYKDNAGGHTHPVKGKKPNELGLYDMSGNVFEFCQDHWHGDYQGAPTNGEAWESTVHPDRVIRGGAWFARARLCRPTYRNHTTFLKEGLGFRLVCGGD